jgi:hypothetical protein
MYNFVFLAFPLALIAYSIWRLHGVWKISAIACCIVVLPFSVTDMQRAVHGGNLTGIYTVMLARPILIFLLILHGTSIAASKSQRMQKAIVKYTMATLSSVLLLGSVLYLWSFLLLLPLDEILLARVPVTLYWIIGGLLSLVTAVYSFRAIVDFQMTRELSQHNKTRPQSPAISYTLAIFSSFFHFVGVLYLVYGYVPLGFPVLRQINSFVLFSVAGLLALVAGIYSFQAIVKPRTIEKFNTSINDSLESDSIASQATAEKADKR